LFFSIYEVTVVFWWRMWQQAVSVSISF